eukprot:PhF_6_TR44523/c0_g1_i1/m.68580
MSTSRPSARPPTIPLEEWRHRMDRVHVCRTHLNHLVMEWLCHQGLKDAAECFEKESGTPAPVPLHTLDQRVVLREAIQHGDISTAITQLNTLCPEVHEQNTDIAFSLRLQQLIEIIRSGNTDGAMEYCRIELAPIVQQHPQYLPRLERVVSLLAFEQPDMSPSSDVLSHAHRQHTASMVNSEVLRAQGMEATCQLEVLVKLMLWVQGRLQERAVFPHLNLSSGELFMPE